MKLRPTDNHSIRSILRRILLLGIGLMVVAGLWAPAAQIIPRRARMAAATDVGQALPAVLVRDLIHIVPGG